MPEYFKYSQVLPATTCPDGSSCEDAGVCLENADSPGIFHCDCDNVDQNAKFSGLDCLHLLPVNCKQSAPLFFPQGYTGPDITCFNEGDCHFGENDTVGCDCKPGYSGDYCQFVGDPDNEENNPTICPNGNICKPGSVCYKTEGADNEYYCDCDQVPENKMFHGFGCHHNAMQNCSKIMGLKDPFVCYNGGTCHNDTTEDGGVLAFCDCAEGYHGMGCQYINDTLILATNAGPTTTTPSSAAKAGISILVMVGVLFTILLWRRKRQQQQRRVRLEQSISSHQHGTRGPEGSSLVGITRV